MVDCRSKWRRLKDKTMGASFLLALLVLAAARSCRSIGVDLPLGDINVVVITDDHSWVGGHGAHESLDADYGDILSFYERLVNATNKDVFLIHNGDWIDGTGLSTYPPVHLEPILLKMPWDAFNVGNHDLYKSESVAFMTRHGGLVEKLGQCFLTSNLVNASTGKPIGHGYRHLRGKNTTVLTFGFIYNLEGIGSELTRVERVEEVVRNKWFTDVLRANEYDAILVLAHMGVDDSSFLILLSAIRNETYPTMPVQFVTGHTHRRRFDVLDDYSTAIESGCYLDTIGFVSFPIKQTASSVDNETALKLFRHEFIDSKVDELANRLGVSKLKTENGQALTEFIRKTQNDMGLSRVVGCSPRTYYMNRSLDEVDSLYGLWARGVVATQFLPNDHKRLVLLGKSSSFRYDLFEGNVTVDDLMIVSPFNDSMYLIASDVPTTTIVKLNETMNQEHLLEYTPMLPDFILMGNLTMSESHDLYTLEYEVPFIKNALETITGRRLEPKPVNAFATSLWLTFIQSFWPTCPSEQSYSQKTDTKEPSRMVGDAIALADKRLSLRTPASPEKATMVVVMTSAMVACILLGRFMLRRLPVRRHQGIAGPH